MSQKYLINHSKVKTMSFKKICFAAIIPVLFLIASCNRPYPPGHNNNERSSEASHPEQVTFSSSHSSDTGKIYEVLPGPAALDMSQSPTPFSNNIKFTTGSYSYTVVDKTPQDSKDSKDEVTNVHIIFTGNNGRKYLIDHIDVIHKAEGSGEHTFFGGVGLNKVIHGNTGVGTNLEPKLLAYIALWGTTDLKDAATGKVIAAHRLIHIMTTTKTRDANYHLITSRDIDSTDHDIHNISTHIILAPMNMKGEKDAIPGTDHGFLHMMFQNVKMGDASRNPNLVYEVLPGPSAIIPSRNPTPFSNRVAWAAGSYNYTVKDATADDAENSRDEVKNFSLTFKRMDGKVFTIDNIQLIHKAKGTGQYTYFGGVGFDKVIHGNTGIGTNMEPKLLAYVALWGTADLKNGKGVIISAHHLIHVMTTTRVRTGNLTLITDTLQDKTDHSPDMIETHIIIPPMNMDGQKDPVMGTGHGFLHLMFEKVKLEKGNEGNDFSKNQ